MLQCCNLIGSLDSNRVYENPLVRCILINAYHNQWGSFSFNFIACKVPPPPIFPFLNKTKRLFPQNFCGVKSGNYLSMFLFTIFSLWFYKPQESETWQPNLVLHDCFLWWLDLIVCICSGKRRDSQASSYRVFPFYERWWWKLEELRLAKKWDTTCSS